VVPITLICDKAERRQVGVVDRLSIIDIKEKQVCSDHWQQASVGHVTPNGPITSPLPSPPATAMDDRPLRHVSAAPALAAPKPHEEQARSGAPRRRSVAPPLGEEVTGSKASLTGQF
jgi:hypothetical protein